MSQFSINPFDVIIDKLNKIETALSNQSHKDADPIYLKIDKAATFLSLTPNALRVMVHKNQITYIKKQGKIYFNKTELIDWLESGRVYPMDVNLEMESILVRQMALNRK
jgi:hypothetical protein